MEDLRSALKPLWERIGGRKAEFSVDSRHHEEFRVFQWIKSLMMIGYCTEEIRIVCRTLLAILCLYHSSYSEKSEVLIMLSAQLLEVPARFLLTMIVECENILKSFPAISSILDGSIGYRRYITESFCAYVHKQLYASVSHRIDSGIRALLVPTKLMQNLATDFCCGKSVHIISCPTNIDLKTSRTFGDLACLLSQSLCKAYAFLDTLRFKNFCHDQGLIFSDCNISNCCLQKTLCSDDVLLAFMSEKGLLTWASEAIRTPKDLVEWLSQFEITPSANLDRYSAKLHEVFGKIDSHNSPFSQLAIRLDNSLDTYCVWNDLDILRATIVQPELHAIYQLILQKSSIARGLQWNWSLDGDQIHFNEAAQVMRGIEKVLRPLLGVDTIVLYNKGLDGSEKAIKQYLLDVLLHCHSKNLSYWIPRNILRKTFPKTYDQIIGNDQANAIHSLKKELLQIKQLNMKDTAFAVGSHGALVSEEIYDNIFQRFLSQKIRNNGSKSPTAQRAVLDKVESLKDIDHHPSSEMN